MSYQMAKYCLELLSHVGHGVICQAYVVIGTIQFLMVVGLKVPLCYWLSSRDWSHLPETTLKSVAHGPLSCLLLQGEQESTCNGFLSLFISILIRSGALKKISHFLNSKSAD